MPDRKRLGIALFALPVQAVPAFMPADFLTVAIAFWPHRWKIESGCLLRRLWYMSKDVNWSKYARQAVEIHYTDIGAVGSLNAVKSAQEKAGIAAAIPAFPYILKIPL